MGPLTGVETLFILLGTFCIAVGLLLGGMNEEDREGL